VYDCSEMVREFDDEHGVGVGGGGGRVVVGDSAEDTGDKEGRGDYEELVDHVTGKIPVTTPTIDGRVKFPWFAGRDAVFAPGYFYPLEIGSKFFFPV